MYNTHPKKWQHTAFQHFAPKCTSSCRNGICIRGCPYDQNRFPIHVKNPAGDEITIHFDPQDGGMMLRRKIVEAWPHLAGQELRMALSFLRDEVVCRDMKKVTAADTITLFIQDAFEETCKSFVRCYSQNVVVEGLEMTFGGCVANAHGAIDNTIWIQTQLVGNVQQWKHNRKQDTWFTSLERMFKSVNSFRGEEKVDPERIATMIHLCWIFYG